MGRTNYSLNEMLNSVTKRAFNRYTSQTVDYQHLEAATTTTGLVSNRREYSSASILADTFSLNAQNIVESNYDPFLRVNVNSIITSKANDIPQVGHLSSCTDDGRFLAVTETNSDNVRVYEFNNSLADRAQLSSLGTINTNEIMDVILKLRKHAKINKDFITADLIRDELDGLGVQINDSRDGSSWQIKD